jgi:long-chain acyl-CoA synthetase
MAYNAILALGGIVVAINPLNSRWEIGRELRETGAETLIFLDQLTNKLPEKRPKNLIVTEATTYAPWIFRFLSRLKSKDWEILEDCLSLEKIQKCPLLKKPAEVDPIKDLAVIQYTGGTTGHPKGVMLTHYNLVSNTIQSNFWLRGWGYSNKPQPVGWPVVICAIPFFHIYGMTVAMNESIQFGCSLVLVPEPKPEVIMVNIQRYRATHLPVIPRMIREIMVHPKLSRYDLTSLTSCVSGGAAIEPDLVEQFIEVTGAKFYHGYGLTEASPTTHCPPFKGATNYRTVGLSFPDTETKIVDLRTGGIELPVGDNGELMVKGPQVMVGYWNKPEETSKVLKDGWLLTGDIVHQDVDGFLYIVDRKQNRIVSAGHTIWPSEVEKVLESHPLVESAIAIGELDPLRCTTDICSFVVINRDSPASDFDSILLDYCRHWLEPYKVPSKITLVDALPLNSLGKVNRRVFQKNLKSLIEANPRT